MAPQAAYSLIELPSSRNSTLYGRSQHGRQLHCELVGCIQARIAVAILEQTETAPRGRELQNRRPRDGDTAIPLPPPQIQLPPQAERAGGEAETQGQEQRQRQQEATGQYSDAGRERQAADPPAAQPVGEQHVPRRRESCLGSGRPSPPAGAGATTSTAGKGTAGSATDTGGAAGDAWGSVGTGCAEGTAAAGAGAGATTVAVDPGASATRGASGPGGGIFSEAVGEGFGAGGRGGFVAVVALSGSDGGLETIADQEATSSGDGSGAPGITIAWTGGSRREESRG
ncbi:unnamed protein product [Closterium sp. Naga37s-1]|nr:unnamed protein product [Closterium sp. Naga37s-1]